MSENHLHSALSARGLMTLVPAILPSMIASLGGSIFTAPAIGGWYRGLAKPFFTPPDVAFPLVWTLLYALMAVAFWRILRAKPQAGPKGRAIALFLAQMALNLAWSYAFFGLRSPVSGLLVIILLIGALIVTIRAFRAIDRAAAYALYPYLAWISFAAVLNAAIVAMN
jgi:tryptophan-rich sensory protein